MAFPLYTSCAFYISKYVILSADKVRLSVSSTFWLYENVHYDTKRSFTQCDYNAGCEVSYHHGTIGLHLSTKIHKW